MDVAIYLARTLGESRVLIGGVDVTEACTGVDVRAHLGETTHLTLTRSTRSLSRRRPRQLTPTRTRTQEETCRHDRSRFKG
jgi:hypothetical protein